MPQVQVILDTGARPREVEGIRSVLISAGFDVVIEASAPPQGDSIWLVLLGLPPTAFLAAFFGEAGKEGWKWLKRFVEDLRAAREPEEVSSRERSFGQVVVRPKMVRRDEIGPEEHHTLAPGFARPGDTSTELVLDYDLPDEAYLELHGVDPNAVDGVEHRSPEVP